MDIDVQDSAAEEFIQFDQSDGDFFKVTNTASEFDQLIFLEIGIRSIPSIIFCITGMIRYFEIKSIGFASRNVPQSKLYRFKYYLQIWIAFLIVFMICL